MRYTIIRHIQWWVFAVTDLCIINLCGLAALSLSILYNVYRPRILYKSSIQQSDYLMSPPYNKIIPPCQVVYTSHPHIQHNVHVHAISLASPKVEGTHAHS